MKNFAITGVGGLCRPAASERDQREREIGSSPRSIRTTRWEFSIATRSTSASSPKSSGSIATSRSCAAAPKPGRVHVVSVCSPNYLHDAHIRLALRAGADVICEKPLVINPWNLEALQELEQETGQRVNTVLQLRLHPAVARVEGERCDAEPSSKRHEVDADLRHRARRLVRRVVEGVGRALRRDRRPTSAFIFSICCSGCSAACGSATSTCSDVRRKAGLLELERRDVRWFLSAEPPDLPFVARTRQADHPSLDHRRWRGSRVQ